MKFYYQNVYEDGVSTPHSTLRSCRRGAEMGVALSKRTHLGINYIVGSRLRLSVIVYFQPKPKRKR